MTRMFNIMIQLPQLLTLLNNHYLNDFSTKIIGGFDEPFYKAQNAINIAEIQFSHDYIRSALHELAHWCVAGVERRKLDDYGYWYAADGRNQKQQDEFFRVEVKPQTIEWAFSLVCGVKFEASVDNLQGSVAGIEEFIEKLNHQMISYLKNGFTLRVSNILNSIAFEMHINNVEMFLKKASKKLLIT